MDFPLCLNPKLPVIWDFWGHCEVKLFLSVLLGMLLSPWTYGIFMAVLFFLFWEAIFYYIMGDSHHWQPCIRAGCLMGLILGWLIGRWLHDVHSIRVGPTLWNTLEEVAREIEEERQEQQRIRGY